MFCPLCNNTHTHLLTISNNFNKKKSYYKCSNCHLIFLDPNNLLNEEDEKKRYLLHENNINDCGY